MKETLDGVFKILLSLSVLALLHTYLFYPIWTYFAATISKLKIKEFIYTDNLPYVSIVMPVHNEEKLLLEKLQSLSTLKYPIDRIMCFIGSDNSTDRTNEILSNYNSESFPFKIFYLPKRTGKPGVVNYLFNESLHWQEKGSNHITLFTDASVMLNNDTLFNLVKYFKDTRIGMVDACMLNKGVKKENISISESTYVSAEVKLKQWESKAFLTMIGPFGGCFALRSDYFEPIPGNFLVDDFFLCMSMFKKGGKAINSLEAISYETVSQEIKEEFRRKARISAGNLQNLFYFKSLWFPPFSVLAFNIFSHKILRWFGPLFIIIIGFSLLYLSFTNSSVIYSLGLLGFVSFFFFIPLLELVFKSLHIQNMLTKNINYFILMNLALCKGFIDYTKGIKTNVWRPTKRY